MRQIALNLLLNATEAAGRQGQVSLTVEQVNGRLCLAVSDSGRGLSKAASARLLGTGPVAAGGGVGLRLVRDLVTQFKGSISVERVEGTTTIHVEVPAPC